MKQCGTCGEKTMARARVRGPFPWKDYPSMLTHEPIELLRCSSCGEVAYRPGETKKVDHALEATIRGLTIGFIHTILERERCSQIVLASRLGVTPEYISQLKAGSRTAGFQTFNMLKILAESKSAFPISDPEFDLKRIVSNADQRYYAEALKKLA